MAGRSPGRLTANPPRSVLDGPPIWTRDGSISQDDYVVNTVQPPYQPSAVPPASGGDARFADPAKGPLPPQTEPTIGDLLSEKGIDWAWYAQGWDVALADRSVIYNVGGVVNFQPHHQPYNYFVKYAPGIELRERHLKDMKAFWKAAADGTLPAVVFVKPDGANNQHPGESTMAAGDLMAGTIVETLRRSPSGRTWRSSSPDRAFRPSSRRRMQKKDSWTTRSTTRRRSCNSFRNASSFSSCREFEPNSAIFGMHSPSAGRAAIRSPVGPFGPQDNFGRWSSKR